ncbi:hypothetical protein KY289_024332 [Solanum tuberosum]|nr:hypothetical protein KY289_024332 [Solanum tuberosum]
MVLLPQHNSAQFTFCHVEAATDLLILVCLRQIIVDPLLGHLTLATSSPDAWTKIECMFQSQTCARVMQLKSQLQNLSKGNLSILEYFEKKRAIVDSLAESLYVVQDDDFISFVLNGLDSSYGIFKATFNMRSGLTTPEELFGLLLQEKERLAKERCSTTINTQFGSAPSHSMLTQSSSLLQPTLPPQHKPIFYSWPAPDLYLFSP